MSTDAFTRAYVRRWGRRVWLGYMDGGRYSHLYRLYPRRSAGEKARASWERASGGQYPMLLVPCYLVDPDHWRSWARPPAGNGWCGD